MEAPMEDNTIDYQSISIADDFDSAVLPICPPTRYHTRDLESTLGASEETLRHHLQKYYLSQILEIQEHDLPPFALLAKADKGLDGLSISEREALDSFVNKIMPLMFSDDLCDRVGVTYLGHLIHYYCTNPTYYEKLQGITRQFVDSVLHQNTSIIQLAKQLVRCP
jgi:hypothetical protein